MMKNVKILTAGGVIALIIVLLVVVVTHKSPETENGIMGLREAEGRVEELKKKITIPIDEATREKIERRTNDLAEDHKFVEVDGKKYAVSTVAIWELRKIGEPAVPQLIEAAGTYSNLRVRQYALGIIHSICEGQDAKLMEYLPVFVRSMWDKDAEVRGTAVAQIGKTARLFFRHKRQKELEQLIPYLVKALSDKDYVVQVIAGETLFRIGRKDLVPQELIKKEGLETSS